MYGSVYIAFWDGASYDSEEDEKDYTTRIKKQLLSNSFTTDCFYLLILIYIYK